MPFNIENEAFLEPLISESKSVSKTSERESVKGSQVKQLEHALRSFEILPLLCLLFEFIVTDLCSKDPEDKDKM